MNTGERIFVGVLFLIFFLLLIFSFCVLFVFSIYGSRFGCRCIYGFSGLWIVDSIVYSFGLIYDGGVGVLGFRGRFSVGSSFFLRFRGGRAGVSRVCRVRIFFRGFRFVVRSCFRSISFRFFVAVIVRFVRFFRDDRVFVCTWSSLVFSEVFVFLDLNCFFNGWLNYFFKLR